jgi:predicted DNA-binding transcriptional regulator AlpA
MHEDMNPAAVDEVVSPGNAAAMMSMRPSTLRQHARRCDKPGFPKRRLAPDGASVYLRSEVEAWAAAHPALAAAPDDDRAYMSTEEFATRMGKTASEIFRRRLHDPTFPKPQKFAHQRVMYVRAEAERWIEAYRPRQRPVAEVVGNLAEESNQSRYIGIDEAATRMGRSPSAVLHRTTFDPTFPTRLHLSKGKRMNVVFLRADFEAWLANPPPRKPKPRAVDNPSSQKIRISAMAERMGVPERNVRYHHEMDPTFPKGRLLNPKKLVFSRSDFERWLETWPGGPVAHQRAGYVFLTLSEFFASQDYADPNREAIEFMATFAGETIQMPLMQGIDGIARHRQIVAAINRDPSIENVRRVAEFADISPHRLCDRVKSLTGITIAERRKAMPV